MTDKFYYDLFRRNKLWAKRIVSHSRCSDRAADRTITNNYITEQFLKDRVKKQRNKCHYCSFKMQTYNRRRHNGLTGERLDMALPHDKSNVVLCCYACNVRKFTPQNLIRPKTINYLARRKKQADAIRKIHAEICQFTDSRRAILA